MSSLSILLLKQIMPADWPLSYLSFNVIAASVFKFDKISIKKPRVVFCGHKLVFYYTTVFQNIRVELVIVQKYIYIKQHYSTTIPRHYCNVREQVVESEIEDGSDIELDDLLVRI